MSNMKNEEVAIFSKLPLDLIYEILTWMPLETTRQVCKLWRYLTYEPDFVALHCLRTRTLNGYFLQGLNQGVHSSTFISFFDPKPTTSLKFLPEDSRIWSSTHRGLVLCQIPHKNDHRNILRFCVCKPATQQWRAIPNPKTRFHTFKIDIVANPTGPLHFKIIRFSELPTFMFRSGSQVGTVCEIFDSKVWKWRLSEEFLPPLVWNSQPGVEVNNVVYWLVQSSPHQYRLMMLEFDMEREKWTLIPLPASHPAGQGYGEKVSYVDDKLVGACRKLWLIRRESFCDEDEENSEIWTMIDHSQRKWEKVQHEKLMNLKGGKYTVEHLSTRKVVLSTSGWRTLWIDLRRGEVTTVPLSHQLWLTEFFKIESDSERCNLLEARIH